MSHPFFPAVSLHGEYAFALALDLSGQDDPVAVEHRVIPVAVEAAAVLALNIGNAHGLSALFDGISHCRQWGEGGSFVRIPAHWSIEARIDRVEIDHLRFRCGKTDGGDHQKEVKQSFHVCSSSFTGNDV